MKEKNGSSVGRLPARPDLWWKLIQIMKLWGLINVLSEEDRPVWSIVIPKEGAISPSHNPSLNNHAVRDMLQFHFALLLECIFVEGVLEVLQAENAVDWGMVGKQVSTIIWLQGKNYLSLLHLQKYILFASPKAPCSTISPPNWACAHNCRKCTEPPYHWLLNHHFWPLQCHDIQIQSQLSQLQQDHHGMGPGLYTPRDDH